MIVDAHQDISYAAWALQRDFLQSARVKRAQEERAHPGQVKDICTVGLPEMQAGGVGLAVASIFVEPDCSPSVRPGFAYATPQEAHAQATRQLDYYHRLAGDPRLMLIRSRDDLALLESARAVGPTIGLMIDMEGAAPILSPGEIAEWGQRAVRQVGLAWSYGSPYCGGNKQPGPLRGEASALLQEMERACMILDVSHLAEESFWQALDAFHGHVAASHANCRALVPGERQLSNQMIKAIAEREGVIGIVMYNRFLKAGWTPEHGKSAVGLSDVVRHIDHICQIAGDSMHVGIGSDLDGGFGREATPAEIDSVADLRLLGRALTEAGYSPRDVDSVLSGNWLRFLHAALPAA